MVRLLAFVLNAREDLIFGKGLSSEGEPALWQRDLTGAIELWIDVGQPDERGLRKSCARAGRVMVYSYGGRPADLWWQQHQDNLARLENLSVINLPLLATQGLARLAQRTMQLQCTVQDGVAWLADDRETVEIAPVLVKA